MSDASSTSNVQPRLEVLSPLRESAQFVDTPCLLTVRITWPAEAKGSLQPIDFIAAEHGAQLRGLVIENDPLRQPQELERGESCIFSVPVRAYEPLEFDLSEIAVRFKGHVAQGSDRVPLPPQPLRFQPDLAACVSVRAKPICRYEDLGTRLELVVAPRGATPGVESLEMSLGPGSQVRNGPERFRVATHASTRREVVVDDDTTRLDVTLRATVRGIPVMQLLRVPVEPFESRAERRFRFLVPENLVHDDLAIYNKQGKPVDVSDGEWPLRTGQRYRIHITPPPGVERVELRDVPGRLHVVDQEVVEERAEKRVFVFRVHVMRSSYFSFPERMSYEHFDEHGEPCGKGFIFTRLTETHWNKAIHLGLLPTLAGGSAWLAPASGFGVEETRIASAIAQTTLREHVEPWLIVIIPALWLFLCFVDAVQYRVDFSQLYADVRRLVVATFTRVLSLLPQSIKKVVPGFGRLEASATQATK